MPRITPAILDDALADSATNPIDTISSLLMEEGKSTPHNLQLGFGVCLGYLPYSIIEELLLVNYKLLDTFECNDWRMVVENIMHNVDYGHNSLLNWLSFHTAFTDDYLRAMGLVFRDKPDNKEECFKSLDSEHIECLTKTHPVMMKRYARMGLSTADIEYVHRMIDK